jgi:mRNA-degrading endonuclease toxin of MazEF toxin-antitoxin module
MRRGEVWQYRGLLGRRGQSDKRLVVSADLLNESGDIATCYALHVVDSDPGSLLAVETPWGWASVLLLDRPPRSMLTERLGEATPEQMDAVDNALRAVLEL